MKLTAEHFPIACSLQTLVEEHFGGGSGDPGHDLMPLDDLLGYLRNPRDLDLTPFADLLSQTEEMGDPALPSREHTAILRWIGEAMHQFEQRFPLEEPLASQVRRLKPLAVAIALTDPTFLQPNQHPLHQLLDTIHERAVGWQARLGRAGTVLEKQVATAVEGALSWFDNNSVDMGTVCDEFLAGAERDQARAQRMSRRVVEAELGRVKTASAKREASAMINGALEQYAAPPEIGEFLKGPWYDSAQLLLLKFGTDSDQWRQMSATTTTLLDSLQSPENASEERRQHIFAVVTQLPKEMRRWLLSLHHDTDTVNEAMALVEFAHLRILRQQPVKLERIPPIKVASAKEGTQRSELVRALRPIQEGHWFGVEAHNDGMLRVQLVLKEEQEQRLLFTNLAGMKVLDHSFEQFDELLEKKRVTALPTGSGFSLCLAIAAGVSTTEKLNALYARVSEETPGAAIPPVPDTPVQAAPEATIEDAGKSAELEAHTPLEPQPDLEPEPEPEPELEPEPEPQPEPGREPEPEVVQTTEVPADTVPAEAPDEDMDELFALIADDDSISSEGDLADLELLLAPEEEPFATEDALDTLEMMIDEPDSLSGERDEDPSQWLQPPDQSASEPGPKTDSLVRSDKPDAGPAQPDKVASADSLAQADPQAIVPSENTDREDEEQEESSQEIQLDLPMGAWLGFHDGDTPLMAKLAVHDPEEDTYIFVNRSGIKMRQISGADLRDLVLKGMVDVLQTTSNFRQEVNDVRKKLDS